MSSVTVYEKEIVSANILSVVVGTNCPAGGDSGHGGRTVFKLVDGASTDLKVRLDRGPQQEVDEIEMIFGGDSECETLIEALEFALIVLKSKKPLKGETTRTVQIP